MERNLNIAEKISFLLTCICTELKPTTGAVVEIHRLVHSAIVNASGSSLEIFP